MSYQKRNGEYSEQEKLEIDQEKLSHAKLILNRKGINHFSKKNI